MSKQYSADPEKCQTMLMVLEGLSIMLMLQGVPKEEAITVSMRMFLRAHDEATMADLEASLAEDGDATL